MFSAKHIGSVLLLTIVNSDKLNPNWLRNSAALWKIEVAEAFMEYMHAYCSNI